MLSGSIIDSGGLKAPSPRELSAVRLTEGVNKYFACADYGYAKFMTAEEQVTVIRLKNHPAHISRGEAAYRSPKVNIAREAYIAAPKAQSFLRLHWLPLYNPLPYTANPTPSLDFPENKSRVAHTSRATRKPTYSITQPKCCGIQGLQTLGPRAREGAAISNVPQLPLHLLVFVVEIELGSFLDLFFIEIGFIIGESFNGTRIELNADLIFDLIHDLGVIL